ncbi:MAG: hypothetical protein PGN11_05000 [Quadrisphaera sp.]
MAARVVPLRDLRSADAAAAGGKAATLGDLPVEVRSGGGWSRALLLAGAAAVVVVTLCTRRWARR